MATTRYNAGQDVQGGGNWIAGTYRFLLLQDTGYVPDVDDVFVADLTPGANEVSVAGYSRQTAAGKTRTVDNAADRTVYDCTDPNFGTLTAGQDVAAMVLYKFVTSDADSILVCYYPIGPVPTSGTPFVVQLASSGVTYVDAP